MTDASVGAAGGVGNYKGVMLCNRPFAGSAAAQKAASKPATFSCGLVPDAVGIGQPASSRKKVKRPKKETVLTKHRRWLAELQMTKDKLEAEFVDNMLKKQEKKDNFQAQEKLMRVMSKEVLHGNLNKEEGESKGSPGVEEKKVASPGSDAKPTSKSRQNKPAWAKVQDDSVTAEEKDDMDLLIDDDDEGLLDFASNLDFNAVIEDIEVKSLMKKLKEKIKLLEKDVKNEEDRDLELELAGKERELLNKIRAADMDADAKSEGDEEDINELAKLVLEENSDMGAVQSKASVTSMLQQAKDKISNIQQDKKDLDSAGTITVADECVVSGEPPIVVHEPSEGARVEGKNTASNLPYIRRNPAAV